MPPPTRASFGLFLRPPSEKKLWKISSKFAEASGDMQHLKGFVLTRMRLSCGGGSLRCLSAATRKAGSEELMARVVGLVKKFDKLDADKVTETADFQKDLSLDSLDRVELVMAFEQEFSIEIPDSKADRFRCCADVVEYILTQSQSNKADAS